MLKERGNNFALQNFHQYQKLATKKKPQKTKGRGKVWGEIFPPSSHGSFFYNGLSLSVTVCHMFEDNQSKMNLANSS